MVVTRLPKPTPTLGECPKCGNAENNSMVYHADNTCGLGDGEHLHFGCSKCTAQFSTLPLDAKKNKK
jgi:hypothetical protein